MEGPLPPLSAAPTAAVYPETIESSPHTRHTDSWDPDQTQSLRLPQKLRLMCSYGGHIVPRPHDKVLCYIGGDTRIIVIDRHTSLSDLHQRLSKTLLNCQPFSLKYQLPNENLDSLISVTTDEDLDNMVEEYDRLNNTGGGSKPGRLRLFLFPKTSSNIEQFLAETASTKSDDWFFNALNGRSSITLSTAVSDRGFSESSSVNCLLGLDDDLIGKAAVVGKEAEALIERSKIGGSGNGNAIAYGDVHSILDSRMLETMSSFGSTSSSPSMENLPPIRVRVEENLKSRGLEIEDQFQQMSMGITGNVNLATTQMQEEIVAVVSGVPVVVGGEFPNRVISDDERSEHGGFKKAQQVHLQPEQNIPQFQLKQTGACDLPSPDSASSEGSATVTPNPADPKSGDQNKVEVQPQVQESGYYFDQSHPQLHPPPQFVHAGGNQYIPAGAMAVPSYYSVYPSQQQQYPIYLVPARPTQAYNLPMQQPSYSELATTAPSSHAQPYHHAAFNQAMNTTSKPELSSGMHRTATGAAPQLVQIPSSQHQAQYVGFAQIHRPSLPLAPPSSATNFTCSYEFSDPTHAQMYYAPQYPPQLAAQYQTPTSTPAVATPDISAQLPADNIKQQVRPLQQ